MRASRILILALALGLLGLLPAAAQAKPSDDVQAAGTVSAQKAKKVSLKIVKKKGKLFAVGNVKPKKKSKLVIEKATKCVKKKGNTTCKFKKFKKLKTSAKGHYKVRVKAPKKGSWVWRARVGKVYSSAWLTCRLKPGQIKCPNP